MLTYDEFYRMDLRFFEYEKRAWREPGKTELVNPNIWHGLTNGVD